MHEWLTEIRKNNVMSQKDVAKSVGISQSYYSEIESGVRRPSVRIAKKLGITLGFDWTELYRGGEEDD